MITPAVLDEIQERIAKGYPIRPDQIASMATMLRSHPAISLFGSPSQPARPDGNLCTFPECQCVKACNDYVRARQ